MSRLSKKQIGYISSTIIAIESAQKIFNQSREWLDNHNSNKEYSITLIEGDSLYESIDRWITDQINLGAQKKLVSVYKNKKLKYFLNDDSTYTIDVNGCKISFFKKLPEKPVPSNSYSDFFKDPQKIILKAETYQGKLEIQKILQSLAEELEIEKKIPQVKYYRWGDWNSSKELPNRKLNSVVLKKDQLERIVEDLENFFKNEERYVSLGVPWHRGYLFHGTPGTGKSSLAQVLAKHFNLDICFASLSTISDDRELFQLVTSTEGILLLEDVDIFSSVVNNREDDPETKGPTLSGLLNSLDGLVTPHGLIVILTTNKKDNLDEALLRSGRIDLIEEITDLDTDQLYRLFESVYNEPLIEGIEVDKPISPATVMEIFKNEEDPTMAIFELMNLLEKKDK